MYCSKQLKNLIIFHQVVGILITTWLLKQVLSIAMPNPDIEILSLNCMSSSQEIVVVHDCMVDMFSEVLQPPNAQNRAVGKDQMIKKTIQAAGGLNYTWLLHAHHNIQSHHTQDPSCITAALHRRAIIHSATITSHASGSSSAVNPQPVGSNGCWQGHQTCSVA